MPQFMNNLPRHSLANRLLRFVSICAIVYLVLLLALMIPFGFKNAQQAHTELEQKLVLSLSNSAAIALYVNNHEIAEEVIDSLLLHDEINAVRLESLEGVTFDKIKPGQFEKDMWLHANQYPLLSPVDAKPLGILYVHDNHLVIQRKTLDKVLYQILFVLLQFLMTFVVIALVVKRIIGKPLRALSIAVSRATPGQVKTVEVDDINRNNEIGLVANSINTFIENSHQALIREKELRSQIERWEIYYRGMAEQDTLTGLKNRLGCEKYFSHMKHSEAYLSLLLIDLDGFKAVNDSHGHAVGDAVLSTIANRYLHLTQEHFNQSVVGRIGGDEFVIYLPHRDGLEKMEAFLLAFAEQLIESSNTPIEVKQLQVHVGCSIGIATATAAKADMEKLLLQADNAMYLAKQDGKNTARFFRRPVSQSVGN
ncbi:TPA: sensor domain-containing diguanylate cyclase [Vibrio vulnificus]|uniref:Sensor domain-containing diguanylate cyclase n=1 Tax=Vibrio vulnificus TaxID=672 RepID=A0A8H9N438_VIBVL|nr:diguanylate cyclase [Vibrio vulnificus]EGQ9933472.1 diguanylate cyclase [Vibrio vulnificus]ELI0612116.1 diguanylate cyclase [Vibrio vulnificus]MCU8225137.1 diguanylate cyclase [Vibrio vulnificus]MCU8272348.1 diguanylate cyclase [Vibrio vulnificus]RZQ14302.1 sensor domain-containing diguanylate cyclase [Vibrio vulnificus]